MNERIINKLKENHPERPELLEHSLRLSTSLDANATAAHIRKCQSCASLDNLLSKFPLAGESLLPSVPETWTTDAYNLFIRPQPESKPVILTRLEEHLGKLMFDSWAIASLSTVRSLEVPKVRHFRIESSGVVIDFRAERSAESWTFVAEIVTPSTGYNEFVAQVGSKRIEPNESGFYHWSATRPSQQMKFVSDEIIILLPSISWRQPLTN